MPSWETNFCQRKTLSACVITSLVLLVGLLTFVVIFLTFIWQDNVEEHSFQDPDHSLLDDMYDDDCRSTAAVIADEAMTQRWDSSNNFSDAWRNAESKAKAPAHIYMEKYHSTAIYVYTNILLEPAKHGSEVSRGSSEQQIEMFESLYHNLSEAIQILKHSQVTCLSTTYRTDTLLYPNISEKLVRFNTFILASDWSNSMSISCFQVFTCFGANITHYSASQLNSQVLIPPYEVFKVIDIQTGTQRCKVLYKLKSDLNCVYDRQSNKLHPISADNFWLIFTVHCVVIVSLLLPCVILKMIEKRNRKAVFSMYYSTD